MKEKVHFLLTLGSTLAIGWFGSIGAYYIEMIKPYSQRSAVGLFFALLAVMIVGFVCGLCFYKAYKKIEDIDE